jgi:mono/diheme cytochrome c family protein
MLSQPREAHESMLKKSAYWIVGLLILAVAAFLLLARRPAIAPIEPPAASTFAPEQVARGKILASAGNCASCHTVKGGEPFSGGLAIATPFGTVYAPNITPDAATGIGNWSNAAFARALHEGVARDGSNLFPVFPFDHYTRVTDEDVAALYAYLMTLPAVSKESPSNTLPFPLNVRALQYGWKLLFFHPGVYRPDPAKSEAWNRGAYLAEALAHCSSCHSPRNALGAEKSGSARYAGGQVDRWTAPALTAANPAPLPWSEDELYGYLRSGGTALHGVTAGPMSEVIHVGLAALPDADVRALATYFADVNGSVARASGGADVLAKAMSRSGLGTEEAHEQGAELFRAGCASCHYNSGATPLAARPELGLSSALAAAEPTDLVQVILHGIALKEGAANLAMPSFAHLSDADIATLCAYLRRTRTDQPAWTDLEAKVMAIRGKGGGS